MNSLAITALLIASPTLVLADLVVVVHPDNSVSSITDADISRIFLKKTDSFPDKNKATPIDQKEGNPLRDAFYSKVTKKDAAQLNSYWSRLIFTGKGTPPKVVRNDKKVKSLISKNADHIGYIDSASVDDTVKVVFTLK
ncbi:MAG: phosphate ABC transporter substrate-binding protein [Gammaproteobacteria bacterium]|nr:MAG: phosphate ABC transporter substrate-binding protein [Gammaproteobacteria bacterium]